MWRASGLLLWCWLGLSGISAAGGPSSAAGLAESALTDARRLGPLAKRAGARYLSLHAIPETRRADFLKALTFHCNSLSREPDLVAPKAVGPDLVRVFLADYGWSAETWEKLAGHDPYYHARTVETVTRHERRKERVKQWYRRRDGSTFWRWEEREKRVPVSEVRVVTSHAPWLPRESMSALSSLTGTEAPLLRAEWFLATTSTQEVPGVGYFDWLGVSSRDDFDRVVALDKKLAIRVRKEVAAVVADSGVALNNRQILRYQTITGGYWQTLDVIRQNDREGDAKRNALRITADGFAHDAEEIYGFLPNGLLATYTCDDEGKQADTVPDAVASDGRATSNDRRIKALASCVRCHQEGLQPIDDWARKVYRGPVQLQSKDYKELKRLKHLYLSPLQRWLERDLEDYAAALERCNGLEPKANAELYAEWAFGWREEKLDIEQTAAELYATPEAWEQALKAYSLKGGRGGDPVLVQLLAGQKIRREHWEEVYQSAQRIVGGVP